VLTVVTPGFEAEIVTVPVPDCRIMSCVPVLNGTDRFVGTNTVAAVVVNTSTILPESAATNV
jgi:hypothetical protein